MDNHKATNKPVPTARVALTVAAALLALWICTKPAYASGCQITLGFCQSKPGDFCNLFTGFNFVKLYTNGLLCNPGPRNATACVADWKPTCCFGVDPSPGCITPVCPCPNIGY